jgi:DNA polymerase-4
MLRGEEEADYPGMTDPARHTVSHSHVLGPDMRSDSGAEKVLLRLTGKAVTRMRRKRFMATGLQLNITWINTAHFEKRHWSVADNRHEPAADPLTWIAALRRLWDRRPPLEAGWTYQKVGIALTGLTPFADQTESLFDDDVRRLRLAEVMDSINAALGAGSVDIGSVFAARDLAPERIAFAKISDDDRERLG